mmetsp:Transcript_30806/g.99325  ORF Transcript_30806/g.99325 Transcript_30806/m.99325 type:complete len:210 (+) Transcript_30806:1237-1866(+)
MVTSSTREGGGCSPLLLGAAGMPLARLARSTSSSAPSPASPARTSHRKPGGKVGGLCSALSRGTDQPPEPAGESCIELRAAKTDPALWLLGKVARAFPGRPLGGSWVTPDWWSSRWWWRSPPSSQRGWFSRRTLAYSSAEGRPTKEPLSVTERKEFLSVKEFRSVNDGRFPWSKEFPWSKDGLWSSEFVVVVAKAASTASPDDDDPDGL